MLEQPDPIMVRRADMRVKVAEPFARLFRANGSRRLAGQWGV